MVVKPYPLPTNMYTASILVEIARTRGWAGRRTDAHALATPEPAALEELG